MGYQVVNNLNRDCERAIRWRLGVRGPPGWWVVYAYELGIRGGVKLSGVRGSGVGYISAGGVKTSF